MAGLKTTNNNNSKNKARHLKEVLFLKLLLLFVVLILPLALMAIDLGIKTSQYLAVQNQALARARAGSPQAEYNIAVPIPAAQAGNLANVSPDKINTLFNNLK